MVESLTNPTRTDAAEEPDSRLREGEPQDQGPAGLAAHRPGRPEDPADAPVRQRRGRAGGTRHHGRAVVDQQMALRHEQGPRAAGTGWQALTENAAKAAEDSQGAHVLRPVRLLRPEPVLPHRPDRGGRLREPPGAAGTSCSSRPPRSRTRASASTATRSAAGQRQRQRHRRHRGLRRRQDRQGQRVQAHRRQARSSPRRRRSTRWRPTSSSSSRRRRRRRSPGVTRRWSRASPTARRRSCCRTPR